MVEIKDYDADSYELEFEEDTLEEERQFFVTTYPNVNMVADRRLHCTTCNTHIGCAVANELTIRMHPVLRVTHCKKCHTFYNSGEFSKGEDGSELYCRWCGQGGEVYCCSKCPYVFCKKCIVQNLSRSMVTEIENNDNWNCFSCSPKVMWPLRAQHWALVNYIEKTKKRILNEEKDDDKIYELMNKDPTLCCRDKKAHKSRKDSKKKRKRRYSSTSSSGCSTPEPKRIQDHSAVLPKMVAPPAQQKSSKQLDELVCTPDILSMFSEPVEMAPAAVQPASKTTTPAAAAPASVSQKSAASQPPPLLIRQLPTTSSVQTVRFPNRQFSAVPRVAAPPPAYYTVNGFRVDLNAAAQQETYRLPNGKLIQVKKQTAANQLNANNPTNRNAPPMASRSNVANPNPYSIRFNIQPTLQPPIQIQQPHQPVPAHQSSAAQSLHQQQQHLQQQHLQQQQQILNGLATAPMVPITNAPALQTQLVTNRYPSTPLGQAQTELEKQIHNTQEICQQIVSKCNTLMKSNAYKSVRNYNDVKDLHLHLSYLFTYTIDKFTTLQSKCTDEMKSLTNAHEAANKLADKKNKYTNADDDLEVVEPTTVCIEIDSDDEVVMTNVTPQVVQEIVEKTTTKSKQSRKSNHQPKTVESIVVSTTNSSRITINSSCITTNSTRITTAVIPAMTLSTSVAPLSTSVAPLSTPVAPLSIPVAALTPVTPIEIDNNDNDDLELPTPPALESDKSDNECEVYDSRNDSKLKSLPKVVLEKDEEIERKLKEILEKEKEENGVASPMSESSVASPLNDESAVASPLNDEPIAKSPVNDESVEKSPANDESVSKSPVNDEPVVESPVNDESIKESTLNDESGVASMVNDESMDTADETANESVIEINDTVNTSESTTDGNVSKTTEAITSEDKGEKSNKSDDLTNGEINDEAMSVDCPLNNTDVSCPESPALTDGLDNDLLDEMDHQNNLTDNSFENISSPDMFDDMSKNGFDKPENIVTLSTENADPDLV